jgi:hypothetical protein
MRRRPHKYYAQRTTVDGIAFASKKEAAEYGQLKLRERAGQVWALLLQPVFELHAPSGEVLGRYIGDFFYIEGGRAHVVDVKGFKTELYKWKRKHVMAEYAIDVEER